MSDPLVEKTGMAAVLYGLTGVGGPWAQDPPYYAEVVAFETGPEKDWAHIRLAGWRGWVYDRWVYFYHNGGPVVVVDEAKGPQGTRAALVWHLVGGEMVEDRRIWLQDGEQLAEVVLIPTGAGGRLEVTKESAGSGSNLGVVYSAPAEKSLRLVRLLLVGEWAGAEVGLDTAQSLWVAGQENRIILPLALEDLH